MRNPTRHHSPTQAQLRSRNDKNLEQKTAPHHMRFNSATDAQQASQMARDYLMTPQDGEGRHKRSGSINFKDMQSKLQTVRQKLKS